MKIIKITLKMNAHDYLNFCDEWESNDDVSVDTSEICNAKAIEYCVNLVMSLPKREFSSVIFEELSEKKETPMEMLKEIICLGDRGCIESVCMRTDLSDELMSLCHSLNLEH